MTETQFIEQNKKQWNELEELLELKEKDPDRLHDLFVKVSSDLAYASTFYPKRSVRAYLNQLTQRVFDSMEEKKREINFKSVINFFRNILPTELYAARKSLLTSFIIFTIALFIGIVSTAQNPEFPRVILGDRYIEMTQKNIDKNDPMAVYKSEEQSDMFFNITVHNIKIAMICYILGIFGSLGTIVVLFQNGIMVGAFQYYFYSKGLFVESFLTIWIHGTIEISAIIIAGAAGIVLGNGVLFPKTYDRGTSIQMAAKRSIRILVGTVPLLIIAGFLESFITRLTGMPTILKIAIIGLSLLFILGLYVFYPWWHNKNSKIDKSETEVLPNETAKLEFERHSFRDLTKNIYLGFAQFRINMGSFFSHGVSFLMVFIICFLVFYQWLLSPNDMYDYGVSFLSNYKFGGFPIFFMYWFAVTFALMILTMLYRKEKMTLYNKMVYIKLYFTNMLLVTLLPMVVFYFTHLAWMLLVLLFFPPHFIAYLFYMIPEKGWKIWSELSDIYSLSVSSWGRAIVTFALAGLLHLVLVVVLYTSIGQLFLDFISWHDMFSGENVTHVFVMTTIFTLIFFIVLPLYFYVFINQMNSEKAKSEATDLWRRYKIFNKQSSVFESRT